MSRVTYNQVKCLMPRKEFDRRMDIYAKDCLTYTECEQKLKSDYVSISMTIRKHLQLSFPDYHIFMVKSMTDSDDINAYCDYLWHLWNNVTEKTIMVFLGYYWSYLLLNHNGFKLDTRQECTKISPCSVYIHEPKNNFFSSVRFNEFVDHEEISRSIRSLIDSDVTCVCCLDSKEDLITANNKKPMYKCCTCSAYICRKCMYSSGVKKTNECIVCKCLFGVYR